MTIFNSTQMGNKKGMVKLKVKRGWFRTKEVYVPKDQYEQNKNEYHNRFNIKDVEDVEE